MKTCCVEAVEEVDRHAPSAPRTPRRRTPAGSEARRPEEGLEEQARERDARRRDEQDGPAPRAAATRRSRRLGAGRPTRPAAVRGDEGEHDRHAPERDTHDEERRPEDAERGDAEQVPEPGEPEQAAPRAKRERPRAATARRRRTRRSARRAPQSRAPSRRSPQDRECVVRALPDDLRVGIGAPVAGEAEDPRCVRIHLPRQEEVPHVVRHRVGNREDAPAGLPRPTETANVPSSGIRPRASIAIACAGSTELPPPSARSMLSSRAFARADRFASANACG